METEYNKLIKVFDKQIKKEYKAAKGNKYNCRSWWAKMLFIEFNKLHVDDWRIIRSGDYWETRDRKIGIERDKYILSKIKEYKNKTNEGT